MSNPVQNLQQPVQKRERSRSFETEVDEAGVEQSGHNERLKKVKISEKDGLNSTASTEKSVAAIPSEQPKDARPIQESTMTSDELLRKMMEDDEDEEIEASRPDERTLRKAKHAIREQIDMASKAKREMGKAVAEFDKYFAELERAHVYATTRDALVTSLACIPASTSLILNHTYRMKTELETLQRGDRDDGEMAHLQKAILETETVTEKIKTHHSIMAKEVKLCTKDKQPKGPKGFDEIKRLNDTMQELLKGFHKAWKAVLRFADLVGAVRDAEFETVESEGEEDED